MVAENPPANGDHRRPASPPEPPDSAKPITTPIYESSVITVKALLATIDENFKKQEIQDKALAEKNQKLSKNRMQWQTHAIHFLPKHLLPLTHTQRS